MIDQIRQTLKPTKAGTSKKKLEVETSIDKKIDVVDTSDLLGQYKDKLMSAQISGKKWIEIPREMMAVALREVSVQVGSDLGNEKSFMQNDVRIYMEGSKDALDEKENKIAGC